MLMPLCMIAPRLSGAPVSRLPVIPGWMPLPVANLLKRPSMTLIFVFSGASGWSVWLSSIAAPLPLAHQ